MKKIIMLLMVLILAASTSWAAFVNGSFDDPVNGGTFNGWTLGGGNWHGSTYNATGNPGKSAIVSAGYDPILGGTALSMTYGNTAYAARVNNYDSGFHYSTMSQTITWNDPSIFFAWAAVIQNPNHSGPGHVKVTLDNLTDNTQLYDVFIDYNTHPAGVNWHVLPNNRWGYTDWNICQLDTSDSIGDQLRLTVLASDCSQGAHGGYAYFDGFGSTPPSVPIPGALWLLGSGLLGLVGVRKKLS